MSPAVGRAVFGLGNPDPQYAGTRHNIGWMIADALAQRLEADWESAAKLHAETARSGATLLVKPTTYMNASGRSARAVVDFYKLSPAQALIVIDDINLPFGEIRFRDRGSAGGHRGLADIIAQLGTNDVARLRIGVGAPPTDDATPHVLGKFSKTEQAALPDVIERATAKVREWLGG